MGQLLAAEINPTGELPAPQNPFAAMETLNKQDGFEPTETDHQIAAAHGTQLAGHFLIDREGIIEVGADRGRRADRRPRQVPERRGDPARGPRSVGPVGQLVEAPGVPDEADVVGHGRSWPYFLSSPMSRKRSTASLGAKSSSSNSWRTSISASLPSPARLGKRLVHSIASSRDFALIRV